jgi:fatty-acid desaturase
MEHGTQLRLLQAINHILSVCGITYIATTSHYVWAAVALFSYMFVVVVGQNIGLHRYFAHKGFETYPILSYLLSFTAILATTGSPLAWVAMHRTHHKYSDTVDDPHSPVHVPIKDVLFNWRLQGREKIDTSTSKDILRSKLQQFIHKNYSWIILSYCFVLLLINPLLVVFVYAIPATLCFYSGNIVNAFSHRYGYRNYDTSDRSTNNVWVSLFSVGEGWHNNHHHKPYQWKHGERWWEIDPPAFVIKLIKR